MPSKLKPNQSNLSPLQTFDGVICDELPYKFGSLTIHRRSSVTFWFRVIAIDCELTGTVNFPSPETVTVEKILDSIDSFYLESIMKERNGLSPREIH